MLDHTVLTTDASLFAFHFRSCGASSAGGLQDGRSEGVRLTCAGRKGHPPDPSRTLFLHLSLPGLISCDPSPFCCVRTDRHTLLPPRPTCFVPVPWGPLQADISYGGPAVFPQVPQCSGERPEQLLPRVPGGPGGAGPAQHRLLPCLYSEAKGYPRELAAHAAISTSTLG